MSRGTQVVDRRRFHLQCESVSKITRLPVDVLAAEIVEGAAWGDQPVEGVEVAGELGKGAEPSITFDVIGTIQEGLGLRHEALDGTEGALLVLVGAVVLASPFGDPDRFARELAVEVFYGLDEIVGVHAVVVEAQEIDLQNIVRG